MNTSDRLAIDAAEAAGAGAIEVGHKRRSAWRMELRDSIRTRLWPGVFAGSAIVGLLLAFHDVARTAVQQGELRRQAIADQADAAWRLKSARPVRVGNELRAATAPQDTSPKF